MVAAPKLLALVLSLLLAAGLAPRCVAQQTSRPSGDRQALLREADELNGRVIRLYGERKYAEAIPLAQRCAEIRQKLLGSHADTASSLNNLGMLLQALGKYADARRYLEQAYAIWLKQYGPNHAETAVALNNIGLLYLLEGDYERARPYYERALAIRVRTLGEDPLTAISYNNLGDLLVNLGDYAGARENLERSLTLQRKLQGEKHPSTATSLDNLGTLMRRQGDLAAAQRYHEQALAIRRQVFGNHHVETGISHNNLGNVLLELNQLDAALRHFDSAASAWKQSLGPEHPRTCAALHNVASAQLQRGDLQQARQQFEQVLAVRLKSVGESHSDTADTLNKLANIARAERDFAAARDYHRRALASYRQAFGEQHPLVASTLASWALVEGIAQDWTRTAELTDEARRVSLQHVTRVLPAMSEPEQLTFLRYQDAQWFRVALSGAYQQIGDESWQALAAEWLLNGKAVVQDALAQHALQLRTAKTPEQLAAVDALWQVRRQLAELSLSTVEPSQASTRRDQLAALARQEQTIARGLGQSQQPPRDWISLSSLRARLPRSSALIDIMHVETVEYQRVDHGDAWQPARYLAWIVPPADTGAVQLVDLGPADEIDRLVTAARAAIQAAMGSSDQAGSIRHEGEAAAEAFVVERLNELAQLVLRPLLDKLPDVDHLVLCPDGVLWLAPWCALTLPDGRYAVEAYDFQFVTSSRDLLAEADTDLKLTKALILADPDFDLPADKALAAKRAVLRDLKEPPRQPLPTFSSGSALPQVLRLPGTAAEARAIRPSLATYCQAEPLEYTDIYALEGVLKVAARPRVVVLSTHGFFLAEETPVTPGVSANELTSSGNAPAIHRASNPLLRSGLLLAGCNARGPIPPGGDDGVLTGLEIIGTDLRGTELVVLSACETGLGDVHNGQGVAGLRQAFQLAGARSVVSTLWPIPDRDTALLMTAFFQRLAAGQSTTEALRAAQLARIDARRASGGAAHPIYWAAFTVTGQ